jgi:hypothetical protein
MTAVLTAWQLARTVGGTTKGVSFPDAFMLKKNQTNIVSNESVQRHHVSGSG